MPCREHFGTFRRELEAALRDADRRKDEFLAMLGHELRNPLAPIRFAAHMLKRLDSPDSTLLRARDMIDRQISHMTRLIDDLLDVSRIARNKIRLVKESVDLTRLVRLTAHDHRPAIDAAGLTLDERLPNHSVWVYGDPARLQQIVANLLGNAEKFTDPGGKIVVSLEVVDANARITVEDNGIGIEPSMLRHVFEAATQADSSLARSRGGLGLGLALVKGLTEMHGGQAYVKSAGLGKGSRFTVELPVDHRPHTPAVAASQTAANGVSQRILIIEDNIDAAESVQMVLTLAGHRVETAHSGTEGLRKARQFHPDVVVCDIGLPGELDGYGVAREIRKDRDLSSAYMIAMTGYGQQEDIQRAREAGFDHHLTKPADPEALERLLVR